MPVPKIVLDGSMPYGSRILTINAVTYKVNSLTIPRATATAEDNDEAGNPNRKRWTATRHVLTAELQLATGSTVYPQFGNTFSGTFDSNYGSENYVIVAADYEETNDPGAIRTVSITAEQVINTITTVA